MAHSDTSCEFGDSLIARQLLTSAQLSECTQQWQHSMEQGRPVPIHQLLVEGVGLSMEVVARHLVDAKLFLVSCSDCGRGRVAGDPSAVFCDGCTGSFEIFEDWPSQAPTMDHLTWACGAENLQPAAPALGSQEIGGRVGRYEILGFLGRGGMGEVYLARDPAFQRSVALKVLRLEHTQGQVVLQRFTREGRLLSMVQHPNLVSVLDLDPDGDPPFLVMEYVDGETFGRFLSDDYQQEQGLDIVLMAARGVAAMHRVGIIHRDLKPANILIDKLGVARVTDFGLAKRVDGQTLLTQTGLTLGTPSYMPPEQISGDTEDVGSQSDVYALGVLLYRVLTGRLPFDERRVMELFARVIKEDVPAPRLRRPEISLALNRVCLKATRVDPQKRYHDAGEFVDALQAALDAPDSTRWIMPQLRITRRSLRNAVASLGVIGLMSLCAGAFLLAGKAPLALPSAGEPGQLVEILGGSSSRPAVRRSQSRVVWHVAHGLGQGVRVTGSAAGVVVLHGKAAEWVGGFRLTDGRSLWPAGEWKPARGIKQVGVIGDRVYLTYTGSEAIVLEAATGKLSWRLPDRHRDRLGRREPYSTLLGQEAVYLSYRHGFAALREDGSARWWSRNRGKPIAVDERNGYLAVLLNHGGLEIFDGRTGREIRYRQMLQPLPWVAMYLRFDPTSQLIVASRGEWLTASRWRDGSERYQWRIRVPMETPILEVDKHSVYITGGGRSGDAFTAYDLRDGRAWFRAPRPACTVWLRDAAFVVRKAPQGDELELVRVAEGRTASWQLGLELPGQPRQLVAAGELGLVLLVGDNLVGIDPVRQRVSWQHDPIRLQGDGVQLYWPGGRRVLLVDENQIRLIEWGR